jgi:SAM-dependent methyltransferase
MSPAAGEDRPWFASRFDATYAELYAHRDAAEAERATARLLEPLGLAGRRVLDVGCGPGRWALAVERRGAWAVGLDLSPALLRLARDGGVARLVRGDMCALPFTSASFDLVLCMFTTFGYFATAEGDRGALAEMARVLRPDGNLVLDHLNAVRVRRELVPETRRRLGRFEVRERRALAAAGERIVKEIELHDGAELHTYREEVRLWEAETLAAACGAAGLETGAIWGDYDGTPYDARGSPRTIVQARRRA